MIKSDFEKLGERFSAIGRERLDLLLPLVPLAPDDVLPDLLCLGLAAYHFPQQDEFLSSLAKRIAEASPGAKQRAMVSLRSLDVLSELDSATEFVTQLVPSLPDDVMPLALETSLRSGQPFARMGLLLALAQRVVPNDWVAILRRFLQQKAQELRASDQETKGFESAYISTESLVGLCSFVPEELQQEVLEVVRALSSPSVRAQLLLRLALERQHDEATRESLLDAAWRDWQERPDASSWSDERNRFSSSLGRLPERWRTRWIQALTKEAFEKGEESNSYLQREKRDAVWPLLSPAFQDRWLREQIHHALAFPQHAFHFEKSFYSNQVDIFPMNPRADALKKLSRLLTDELAPYAVLGALTLSHLPTRLEVLEELSFLGNPGAARVQENTLHMTLELAASLEPSPERVSLCARLAYDAEGKMREQIVEVGFSILKRLKQGRGWALRDIGPYLPVSALPEAVSLLTALPSEERREYGEYLLPHFAPKWPESVLALQPSIGGERKFAVAIAPIWPVLTQDVRATLLPLVDEVVSLSLNQLEEAPTTEQGEPPSETAEDNFASYGNDGWWNDHPEDVVVKLFGILNSSKQREVVEGIFPLRQNREMLFDLLPQLPAELQTPTALWLLHNPAPPDDDERSSHWSTQTDYARRIAPYLPAEEREREFDEFLSELRAAAPGQAVVQKSEEDEEEGAGSLSFWGEALSVVRQLLPLWSEAQLRSLLAWLEEWPQSADRTSDDQLLTQDEVWSREQMVALLSSRLASLTVPEEARHLMRRVWEFALFYPYYPEHGGNGADPNPEGVALSPEEVDAQVRRLDPEAQKVWLREAIMGLAKRDAGDLIEAVHQAVHQVRRDTDAVELPAMLERRVAAPQPEIVSRALFLQGKIPAQAVVGQSFVVLVRLAPQESELSAHLREITLQPGDNSIHLLVSVPDFDVLEGERHQLLVPRNGASSWLAFELRPRRVGRFQVQVLAFQGSNYLGDLSATLQVAPASARSASMPEATWQSSLAVDGLASPDTSWVVEYDPDARRLRFHVFEPDGAAWQWQSDVLRTSLPDLVERTVEGAEKKDESLQRLLLSGLGADLWRDCVPADLKVLFEERGDSWKGLQIVSRDESVPWEMLWPSKGGAEPQLFLAERLPICRWVPGSQPTKTLRRQHPCLVSASDAEPSTITELRSVQRLLGAMREGIEPSISSTDRLLQRMNEGDFDWLHFTGHHHFDIDDPASSALHLGKEKFQAAYLGTMEGRWKGQEPFVFLNACRTSGSSPRLTQLDGWAQRCLRAGAAGFAGTSWAVRSDVALRFATAFYENVSKNQPIGAAFFDARLQTRDAIPHNCSWLAYVLYAHSQATVAPLIEE